MPARCGGLASPPASFSAAVRPATPAAAASSRFRRCAPPCGRRCSGAEQRARTPFAGSPDLEAALASRAAMAYDHIANHGLLRKRAVKSGSATDQRTLQHKTPLCAQPAVLHCIRRPPHLRAALWWRWWRRRRAARRRRRRLRQPHWHETPVRLRDAALLGVVHGTDVHSWPGRLDCAPAPASIEGACASAGAGHRPWLTQRRGAHHTKSFRGVWLAVASVRGKAACLRLLQKAALSSPGPQ